jgi:hypothetical protein
VFSGIVYHANYLRFLERAQPIPKSLRALMKADFE